MAALLEISHLGISASDGALSRPILTKVDLDIGQEEIVALVGASGSGKTSLGLSVLGLLPGAMKVDRGSIFFKGRDLLRLGLPKIRQVRGQEIGMIFQDPLSSFNPVFTVGEQIAEVLKTHAGLSGAKASQRAKELLDLVEALDAARVFRAYPHQLSGGLRQRAMIAQAIAAGPELVIADEPTSNLDVTVQAKILALFKKLKAQMHLSILLITHDLGVVRFVSDRVFVLCDGHIAEKGATPAVLGAPQHAFTKKLLDATRL